MILKSLVINKKGKEVSSFRIIPKETDATKEAIKQAKRTDGLWVIVTNNTGKEKEGKKLTEEDLISAYREKNQIEQAFKDVKSFIKIQPFMFGNQNMLEHIIQYVCFHIY